MVEITRARFIKEASQQKHYVVFENTVFQYISSHSKLTANEKLIWLNIAQRIFRSHTFVCVLSYSQIAKIVGVNVTTAKRAIATLKRLGFIQADYDENTQQVTYSIDLPSDGLALIEAAPNRGMIGEKEKSSGDPVTNCEDPPYKMPHPPGANCTTIININNINNKHNTHDLSEGEKTSEPLSVKNADALLEDYQKWQKQYSHFPGMKRIQAVNSHFTEEEQKIIHTSILDEAKSHSLEEIKPSVVPISAPREKTNTHVDQHVIHLQGKLIDYEFENEHYLIEEQVKNQILVSLPMLYRQGKLKGEAGDKPINTLLSEVLFYVTKAGSMQLQPVPQLKRFYVARKLCLQGKWERPRGMIMHAALEKERQWKSLKRQEIKAATHFMGALSWN